MHRITVALGIIIVVLAGAIAMHRCLAGDFIRWDDPFQVLANPLVKSVSLPAVMRIFRTPVVHEYHPLVTLSYALEYHFWGERPFPYHLDNLLLHLINGVLVFWFLYRALGRRTAPALFGAVLFSVHPLQVQAVAWVSGRKDLLSAFFCLLALIRYEAYGEKRSMRSYLACLLLFLGALLSKGTAAVFPLVLVAYDFCRGTQAKGWRRLLAEKIPFFLFGLLFALLAWKIQLIKVPGTRIHSGFTAANFLLAARSLAYYGVRTLFPAGLSPLCPFPRTIIPLSLSYILAGTAVAAVLLLLLRELIRPRGRVGEGDCRAGLFGSLFCLIMLVPVSRLIPYAGNEIVAMRFMYLPMAGLGLALAAAVFGEVKPIATRMLVIVLALFTVLSMHYARFWSDSVSFWERIIARFPDYDLAYHQLGLTFYNLGEHRRAVECFERAIALNSEIAYAYVVKGLSCRELGETAAAKNSFEEGLRLLKKMGRESQAREVEGYLRDLALTPREPLSERGEE